MPISRVHTFANKSVVTGSELDAEFDNIVNQHAAGHTTADLAADAGILLSQMEASIEHFDVVLRTSNGEYGGAWPGGNALMCTVPLVGLTGATAWVVTDIYWACSDTGGGTGTFRVQYGRYAAGAWAAVGWVCAATTMTNAAGADDANAGTVTPTGTTYTLAVAATMGMLALVSTGADATTMQGGVTDHVSVTCRIRRALGTA
jgi:hypothetical protein